MTDIAKAKATVLSHFKAVDTATDAGLAEALSKHTTPNCEYRFVHPFNETTGPEAAAKLFWAPLRRSFSPLQRRQDIFLAGRNRVDGDATLWVASMGHLLGLFDEPFLGIRPTRQAVMLRYAEFNRVENGKIAESHPVHGRHEPHGAGSGGDLAALNRRRDGNTGSTNQRWLALSRISSCRRQTDDGFICSHDRPPAECRCTDNRNRLVA